MKELYEALLSFQNELKTVDKSAKNPFFKSEYVPLEELVKKAQPILSQHGLGITQFPDNIDGKPALTTILFHADTAQTIERTMGLELVKSDPQAQGSAITYARRYAYMSILGLVGDKDDDGNLATHNTKNDDKATSDEPSKDYPATDKTKAYMNGLYKQRIGTDEKDLKQYILDQYGWTPEELTQEQASTIIDDLKAS